MPATSPCSATENSPNYSFHRLDICEEEVNDLMRRERIDAVMHLAAESSSTARSTVRPRLSRPTWSDVPAPGTQRRQYFREPPSEWQEAFRFHHVSTD